ncbi:MAG: hypothetical protein PW845_10200 [Pseudomonas sp.]|uniref:hypothetical protein n=1 Tax=Pseudomonas abieticivorans TaxID=2931382 RepID=UPI0020BEB6BB|nr:hypothetical protein [Pseudomonas sp. PIA16]MDE1165739.1 hypothetical protein [Pseudomonas sp.]
MGWSIIRLLGILGLATLPQWAMAEGNQDYGILIISRERLEVGTPCELGVYIQDQLVGRVFQEQSVSFNLPPGKTIVRLGTLPGQVQGCDGGINAPNATQVTMHAGDVQKFRIATGKEGLYLKPADLNY